MRIGAFFTVGYLWRHCGYIQTFPRIWIFDAIFSCLCYRAIYHTKERRYIATERSMGSRRTFLLF